MTLRVADRFNNAPKFDEALAEHYCKPFLELHDSNCSSNCFHRNIAA